MNRLFNSLFMCLLLVLIINAQDNIKVTSEKKGIVFNLSTSMLYNKYGDSISINFEIINNSQNDIFVFNFIFDKNIEPITNKESNEITFQLGGAFQPEFPIIPKLRLIKKHSKIITRLLVDSKKIEINEKYEGNYNIAVQLGYFYYSKDYLYLTKLNELQKTVTEAEINNFISLYNYVLIGNIPVVFKK